MARDTLGTSATDGTFDMSFSTDGKVVVNDPANSNDTIRAVTQSDGKIVAVGRLGSDLAVARFNTNGTLDATFDGPGGSGNGIFTIDVGGGSDLARAIAIDPSTGKIVVAGQNGGDIELVRLLPATGALDPDFDGPGTAGNGKWKYNVGSSDDDAQGVAIDASGRVVVGGASNGDSLVMRFTAAGALDTTFDGDGSRGSSGCLHVQAPTTSLAFHAVLVLSMTLRMTRIFRMHAVMTTLNGLPAAVSRAA